MKTSFLMTTRKDTGEQRFYVGGCRVSRATFHSLGHSFEAHTTVLRGNKFYYRRMRLL